MKAKLLEKCGKDAFDDFKALNYRSQVVAGSNYFVKVGIMMYLCLFGQNPPIYSEGRVQTRFCIKVYEHYDLEN